MTSWNSNRQSPCQINCDLLRIHGPQTNHVPHPLIYKEAVWCFLATSCTISTNTSSTRQKYQWKYPMEVFNGSTVWKYPVEVLGGSTQWTYPAEVPGTSTRQKYLTEVLNEVLYSAEVLGSTWRKYPVEVPGTDTVYVVQARSRPDASNWWPGHSGVIIWP